MKAIILAAGQGTRLAPLTDDRPKCLVPLAGHPLLEYQLWALGEIGVSDIYLVGGYRKDQLERWGHPVLPNPDFATTNMVASLFCARAQLAGDQDVLIAYADLVYEPRVLEAVRRTDAPLVLGIDRRWRDYWQIRMDDPLADAETLKLRDGLIVELGKKPQDYSEIEGQYMGLIKVRADHLEAFCQAYDRLDRQARYDGRDFDNMFMTSFLQHLIDQGWKVAAAQVDNGWLEVDSVQDLENYHDLLEKGELARFYDSPLLRRATR